MSMPLQVIDLLRHAARNHGNAQIVSRRVEGDVHRYTYVDAYRRVGQCARALSRIGVLPADRVATLAWNGYRHFELYYAIAGIGAVCHTLNPRLTAPQIASICNRARDIVLFFDRSFLSLVIELVPLLSTVRTLVLLGSVDDSAATAIDGLLDYELLLLGETADEPVWPSIAEDAACGLCHTSGTTGEPKGVIYTHRSTILHAYASALPDSMSLSARDKVMPVVPMFHVNAWGLPYSLPMVGAKIVFPGPALDGRSLYELCESEEVTMAAGVPTIWRGLLDHLDETGERFSTLQRTVIGGAAPSETMVRAFEVGHGVSVHQGWGMTETSPVATMNRAKPFWDELDVDARVRRGTMQGRELFGIELRVEDTAGRLLPRDGEAFGALLVRGPWVVSRYDGGGPAARADGWFDTGDIATIDADGYMRIVDRAKDVIKSGGEWISSIDLENAAMAHAAVLEAAVIGMPHPKWDERPLLVCILRQGRELTADALRDFLRERVARWWLPERIEFVESIPHGPTGKVLKTALRAHFSDDAAAPDLSRSQAREPTEARRS